MHIDKYLIWVRKAHPREPGRVRESVLQSQLSSLLREEVLAGSETDGERA